MARSSSKSSTPAAGKPESSPTQSPIDERKILSVADLTGQIKRLLEGQLGNVWVRGEISNLRIPSSGHLYFTLKDENSQITAVLFRGRAQALRFEPGDGMEVIALGRISVYEPRGNYQIICEFLEPAGLGALQAAFEKLKEKLAKEGLFDAERKRPLPYLPRRIGIVTSSTGAAIRDMLKVLGRRNPSIDVLLAPAKVQGEGAATEIARSIEWLNQYHKEQVALGAAGKPLDLIISGRGGGSLEDLWAFNEEVVARAIFASDLPVISAVGHEIDFTISDFVADVRAPTPSAAAEICTPVLAELRRAVEDRGAMLVQRMRRRLEETKKALLRWSERLVRPDKRLADLRLRLDEFFGRLERGMRGQEERRKARLKAFVVGLEALSPLKILARGYAVVLDAASGSILRSPKAAVAGQQVRLLLGEGELLARVEEGTAREVPPARKSEPKKKTPQGQSSLF